MTTFAYSHKTGYILNAGDEVALRSQYSSRYEYATVTKVLPTRFNLSNGKAYSRKTLAEIGGGSSRYIANCTALEARKSEAETKSRKAFLDLRKPLEEALAALSYSSDAFYTLAETAIKLLDTEASHADSYSGPRFVDARRAIEARIDAYKAARYIELELDGYTLTEEEKAIIAKAA